MLKLLFFLFVFPSAFASSETLSEKGKVSSEVETTVAVAEGFKVIFDLESASEKETKLLEVLQEQAIFKKLTDFSAINLQLKSDVRYTFIQGNEPFFGAGQNQVFIPYTFLHQVYEDVRFKYPQQPALSDKLFAFTIEKLIWSELGRVLISQYALPITGKEEISLDQFSTVMLLNLSELDSEYLLDATEEFLLIDDSSTLMSRISFQSETELDELRYRLVLCMVLGKDHEDHVELLDEVTWDQDRLLHCREHYQEKMMAWYLALQPFLKPENNVQKWVEFLPKAEMITDVSVDSSDAQGISVAK